MYRETEDFGDVLRIVSLAKQLHDIGRYDIVEEHFFDTLCYDARFENEWAVITSLFSGFYSHYDQESESETLIFSDDVISDYFMYAWAFGVKTNTPFDKNPYAKAAETETAECLDCCYAMGFKLLGYTKSKKAARQSKLIVYLGLCECDNHAKLANGLIWLRAWFSDKIAEFGKREGVMAA